MNELKWERIGVLSGFVVLLLSGAASALAPIAPPIDKSVEEISTYFSDNRQGILVQNFMYLLASGAFLWFVASLRSYMKRIEGDPGRLSGAAFGAGVAGIAGGFIGVIFPIALALRADGVTDPAVARLTYDLGTISYLISFVPFGVMLAATGLLAFRKAAFPVWLGWVSLVGAGLMVVFASGFLFETGPLAPGSAWSYLFFAVFGVWLVGTTVVMYQRLGRLTAEEPVRHIMPQGRVAVGH